MNNEELLEAIFENEEYAPYRTPEDVVLYRRCNKKDLIELLDNLNTFRRHRQTNMRDVEEEGVNSDLDGEQNFDSSVYEDLFIQDPADVTRSI